MAVCSSIIITIHGNCKTSAFLTLSLAEPDCVSFGKSLKLYCTFVSFVPHILCFQHSWCNIVVVRGQDEDRRHGGHISVLPQSPVVSLGPVTLHQPDVLHRVVVVLKQRGELSVP